MTKSEFANLAMEIDGFFKHDKIFTNDRVIELWYNALKDIPYEVAETGINKWVMTNKFPPTVADIRSMAVEVSHVELENWGDMYTKVLRLVDAFGRNQKELAFKKMDELTRRTVDRMGWENLCNSPVANMAADRANFRDIYNEEKAKAEREVKTKEEIHQAEQFLREQNGNINIIQELQKREGITLNLPGDSRENPQIEEKPEEPEKPEIDGHFYFAKAREELAKKKAQA